MNKNQWINTTEHYGWVSILLHWLLAFALIGMYLLGDYMVELDYYDTWYHKAPALHKAVGILLGIAIIARFLWNFLQTRPAELSKQATLNLLARMGHLTLYGLIVLLVISGYLISTAKGQGIDVFGLFNIPAVLPDDADRGELAGKIHELFGTAFIALVAIHALAALIHHFIFKDRTLKRMLWVRD